MPVQSRDYGSILWNHYLWCLKEGRDTAWFRHQAVQETGHKPQAPGNRRQAPGRRRQGPGSLIHGKVSGTSDRGPELE